MTNTTQAKRFPTPCFLLKPDGVPDTMCYDNDEDDDGENRWKDE